MPPKAKLSDLAMALESDGMDGEHISAAAGSDRENRK